MSGDIPPLLPARGGPRIVPSAPLLPSDIVPNKCTYSSSASKHGYQRVELSQERDDNQYEKLSMTEQNIDTRLQKLEDNQIQIRLELSQFREDITSSMQSLHASIKEIKTASRDLEKVLRGSSALLHASFEKMQQRQLENFDHLGKQIIDVRRDIALTTWKMKHK